MKLFRLAKYTGQRPSTLLFDSDPRELLIDLHALDAFDEWVKSERDKIRRSRGMMAKPNVCYAFSALPELVVQSEV